MNFKKNTDLHSFERQFILLYFCTIVICIIILSSSINIITKNTMQKIGSDNIKQNTLSSLSHISSFIDDIDYTALLIQNNEEVISALRDPGELPVQQKISTISNILNSQDIFQRKIKKIEMYSLLCSDFPGVQNGSSAVYRCDELKNDIWFKEMVFSNFKTKISVINRLDESYVIFSKLIADPYTKQAIGIVSVHVDVSTLYDQLNNVKLFENDMMFLTTTATILNANSTADANMFLNNNELFNNMIKNGIACSKTTISGERYLLHCYPIQDTGLFLTSAVNTAEFNFLNTSMMIAIIITSTPFVVFLLIMLYFISGTLIKPIFTLSDHMRNCSNDLEPISPNRKIYNEEIETLYTSYNEMNATIIRLVNDIKERAQVQRKLEFQVLQAQIKPHFLYNTLNLISAMAADIKAYKIQNIIISLASFFRYSLNSGREFIPIRDELKQAAAYAEIQQYHKNDKFVLVIDVDEKIMNYKICKLILQPLAENAIEHGFKYLEQDGVIIIEGYAEGGDIILKMSDNGGGLNLVSIQELNALANSEPQDQASSFGVYNTNMRIKFYYGENYGLSYSENEMNGITVTIRLPKSNDNQSVS